MRSERISQWKRGVIICLILFGFGKGIEYLKSQPPAPEKEVITVNAPEDMEEAFNVALKAAGLEETHKIEITSQSDANISVGYAKQDDENYQKIAFSPFVVAYDPNNEYTEKLKRAGLLFESPYDDDYLEIDLLKIINEAIGEGKWSNLGFDDEKQFKVFCPGKESVYWNDFRDLLLITVNNGNYPATNKEMKQAEDAIEQFLNSDYVVTVSDFYEQVERTGGFSNNVIYILPEKDVLNICDKQSKPTDLFYPINTVYFNYFVKGDEIGQALIKAFDKEVEVFLKNYNFYKELSEKRYRNIKYFKLSTVPGNVEFARNVYNVVKIPENLELPTEPTSE